MWQKIMLVLLGLIAAYDASSQLERLIVEKYYITDTNDATDTFGGGVQEGLVTYRIYADLVPGTRIISLYGEPLHPFIIASTDTFFNHLTDGQSFAKDMVRGRYLEGTVALDTWLTIGQTVRKFGNITTYGVPKSYDDDGSFIGGVNNDGGSEELASGLLINDDLEAGIPLVVADGMDTLTATPSGWFDSGIRDFVTGEDTTMFGSLVKRTGFYSEAFSLSCSGVSGVVADSNHVILAQLSTLGELSFTFNIEVQYESNGEIVTVKYVGTNVLSAPNEVYSPFLSYPYTCGCNDPSYLEFNPEVICLEEGACVTPIVFGCQDPYACNFDPTANFNVPNLCCYPGWCADRDLEQVCPHLKGESFDFSLFPNPCENTITLNVISGVDTYIDYQFYTNYGLKVKEGRVEDAPLNYSLRVDMDALPSGLYQVRIETVTGVQFKQFVKL
jgi:hypothetical protein